MIAWGDSGSGASFRREDCDDLPGASFRREDCDDRRRGGGARASGAARSAGAGAGPSTTGTTGASMRFRRRRRRPCSHRLLRSRRRCSACFFARARAPARASATLRLAGGGFLGRCGSKFSASADGGRGATRLPATPRATVGGGFGARRCGGRMMTILLRCLGAAPGKNRSAAGRLLHRDCAGGAFGAGSSAGCDERLPKELATSPNAFASRRSSAWRPGMRAWRAA